MLSLICLGLIAGFVGTSFMTLAQLIEIEFTKRPASFTPATVISTLLRLDWSKFGPVSKTLINYLVHFGYGTLWGLGAPLLSLYIANPTSFAIIYFAVFWVAGLIIVPTLGKAGAPWKWGTESLLLDGFYHLVYILFAVTTYFILLRAYHLSSM